MKIVQTSASISKSEILHLCATHAYEKLYIEINELFNSKHLLYCFILVSVLQCVCFICTVHHLNKLLAHFIIGSFYNVCHLMKLRHIGRGKITAHVIFPLCSFIFILSSVFSIYLLCVCIAYSPSVWLLCLHLDVTHAWQFCSMHGHSLAGTFTHFSYLI